MINLGFWGKIQKPILCLAPMADVTDAAFRYIIAKIGGGGPSTHVTFTEFVSADGLVRAPEIGRKKLLKDLEYSEIERPIVAQLFTGKPEIMEKAAKLIVELGFDGLDINMGCPDRNVEKQGAGASLIKNPSLAREIIAAAKQGIGYEDDHRTGERCGPPDMLSKRAGVIPVSVKTRLGYNQDELETWLPELLKENPAVITIHARTRKEMSKVPARWERIREAVGIRNMVQGVSSSLTHNTNPFTLIFGNGDVVNIDDARRKCEETGCDGVMLGRAIFGKPYLFSNSREWWNKENPETVRKILGILLEHAKLFEQKFEGVKNFSVMRKHFKAYLSDIPNSHDLRLQLMEAENTKDMEMAINTFLDSYKDKVV